MKAKNADGLTSKTVKKIRCRKPSVISSSEVTDFMAQSKKAFEEGNIEEANSKCALSCDITSCIHSICLI